MEVPYYVVELVNLYQGVDQVQGFEIPAPIPKDVARTVAKVFTELGWSAAAIPFENSRMAETLSLEEVLEERS